jgi:hypothetical protein
MHLATLKSELLETEVLPGDACSMLNDIFTSFVVLLLLCDNNLITYIYYFRFDDHYSSSGSSL